MIELNCLNLIFCCNLKDSIREMVKYKGTLNYPHKETGFYTGQIELIKELTAQRNFHICGTTLFLWL